MKKILTALVLTCLVSFTGFAQFPHAINFQAIARDDNGEIMANTPIQIRLTIIDGSATGTEIYQELRALTTNDYGSFSFQIGRDPNFVTIGSFEEIDWKTGGKFLKIDYDPTNQFNWNLSLGTIEFVSVPFALAAESVTFIDASNALDGDVLTYNSSTGMFEPQAIESTNYEAGTGISISNKVISNTGDLSNTNEIQTLSVNGNNLSISGTGGNSVDLPQPDGSETKLVSGTNVSISGTGTIANPYVVSASSGSSAHYLGEDYLGGYIFHLYNGSDGQQHGLIVSKTETTAKWQTTISTTYGNRTWDGLYNTNLMTNSPAKTWVQGLGADWYIPAIDELSLLWHARFNMNYVLYNGGNTLLSTSSKYWSSTELDTGNAIGFDFYIGSPLTNSKTTVYTVRAVKSF
jgi:hypothetical protein